MKYGRVGTVPLRESGFELLDCTLRDGGYYTGWDFAPRLVAEYLGAMAAARIRHVELGMRGPAAAGFSGAFLQTDDKAVASLPIPDGIEPGVLVDAKQVAGPPVEKWFRPAAESRIKTVRVAAKASDLDDAIEVADGVAALGYRAGVNLMRAGMCSRQAIADAAGKVDASDATWFHLADSYGNMLPNEVRVAVEAARTTFPGVVGFHAHDNLGLALANALAAIDAGAGLIDCTMRGMGRGAGNLATETAATVLHWTHGLAVDPTALLPLAEGPFSDLKATYRWGTSIPYALSAIGAIHPSYVQELLVPGRYTGDRVRTALEHLRSGGAEEFTAARLATALDAAPSVEIPTQPWPPRAMARPDALIVGSGPAGLQHEAAVREFAEAHDLAVIHCNPHRYGPSGVTAVLNEPAIARIDGDGPILVGADRVDAAAAARLRDREVYLYPCSLGAFDVKPQRCQVPASVVAMFAIAAALRAGAETLFLAGFDGYDASDAWRAMQANEMARFLAAAQQKARLVAVTPSRYALEHVSLESVPEPR